MSIATPTPRLSRVALVVTRTEFRRTLRVVAGDRTKVLVLAAVAVFGLGPITIGGTVGLAILGEQAAAGNLGEFEFATPTEIVSGISALVWVLIAVMATMRTTTAVADLDEPACLLVATPIRNIVVGLVGAEILRFSVWLVVPVLLLSGAFAYGAETALPVLVAIVFLGLVLCSAVAVGFVAGIWIRHLLTVYEPIAQYRTPLIALVAIAYFGAIATGWFNTLMGTLFTTLGDSPLGWPGHVLLVGVPTLTPSTGPLAGAFVGSPAVVFLAIAAGIASARIHWISDPARTDDDGGESHAPVSDTSDRLTTLLEPVFERPVRTAAVTAIRRTKRAPVRLLYVGYPLMGAFVFVQEIIQTGTVPTFVAVLFSLYVVWGAGALFTLNPLGDLGRALPAVMTSTVSGRQQITGLVIAGALVAVPIGILVSLAMGVVSPLSLEHTGLLVAGTAIGTVATPALATGIGSAFPRFGSVNVTNNREAVMPSKTAFLVYTIAIVLPTVAALVLYVDGAPDVVASLVSALLSLVPRVDVSIPTSAITPVSWAVLVAGLAAPLLSYRFAVSRFDGYRLE